MILSRRWKTLVKKIPVIGNLSVRIARRIRSEGPFPGSKTYWEGRYAKGDNSGAGSYGKFATFKAEVINSFVSERGIKSVVEFGCGDGNQLKLAHYDRYLGLDVSETAIGLCKRAFANDHTKEFKVVSEYGGETFDLALSLDVVYHLIEDDVFESYLRSLFKGSKRYVIIYSSDTDSLVGDRAEHVKHRHFSKWVHENIPGWKQIRKIPNRYPFTGDHLAGSFADFFFFEKISG